MKKLLHRYRAKMGSSNSKQTNTISPQDNPPSVSFPEPLKDPESTLEDPQKHDLSLPLDEGGQYITTIPENELLNIYHTAPRIHSYFGQKIVRISKSLVMKGGPEVSEREAGNMKFALERLSLPVPNVHRVFSTSSSQANKAIGRSKDRGGGSTTKTTSFIVADCIHGKTVQEYWDSADLPTRKSIAKQVADMINKMQSTPLGDILPPGPIVIDTKDERGKRVGGESIVKSQKEWTGPWFTEYGAGPFQTLQSLEDWLNHKIDVCIQVKELPPDWPRFKLDKSDLVLTHQDIAPRNLIVDADGKVWLIDWQCAAVLPRGFEQAVLREQAGENEEFVDLVEAALEDRGEEVTKQFRGIQYALSTGRLL